MADAQLATLTIQEGTPSPTSDALLSMTEAQRQTWKMTGELPASAKTEESPTPDTAKEPISEPSQEEAEQPAPEASTTQEKPPEQKVSGAEKRIKQLLGRIKELEGKLALPVETPKAEVITVPAAEKSQDASDPEPTIDGFDTYEQFVKAQARWEARQEFKSQQEQAEKKQKAAEFVKQQEEAQKVFEKRVAEATKRHPDFKEVALSKEFLDVLPKGSFCDAFLLESDHGAEVMYHLASNPDDFARIISLAPIAQARELFKIENQFASGSEPSPAPKVTSAPKPPTVLAAKGMPPMDDAAAALSRGDFVAYRRAANARELASRKG